MEVRGLRSSIETFFANGVLISSFFRSYRPSLEQKKRLLTLERAGRRSKKTLSVSLLLLSSLLCCLLLNCYFLGGLLCCFLSCHIFLQC